MHAGRAVLTVMTGVAMWMTVSPWGCCRPATAWDAPAPHGQTQLYVWQLPFAGRYRAGAPSGAVGVTPLRRHTVRKCGPAGWKGCTFSVSAYPAMRAISPAVRPFCTRTLPM
jgi:hypothetical protein